MGGEHLDEAGAPHALLFERNPNAMWVVDVATLAFVSVNDAAIARYGYSRDEFLSMTVRDIRPPEEQRRLNEWLARPPQTRMGPGEARHRTKDGTILDVEVFATRFETEQGARTLVCVIDITARKRAEAAAVAAERRLQTLIDKHYDGLSLTDASGTTTYVSSAITRVLGRDPSEAVGRNGAMWLHPDDLARNRAALGQLMRTPNATHTSVMRNQHKDGSWRWIEATGTNLLHDPDVRAVVSTFRDVTDRVRAEEALRAANARMQHLLSSTSAILFTLRGATGDSGVTFMSDNVTAVLGYEPRDFIDDRQFWSKNVHPDDRERVLSEIRASENVVHAHEFRFRHKNGHYVWMHDEIVERRERDGEAEIIGCWFDITARKELEEALRRSAKSFRALVDHLPIGVIVQRGGRIAYANRTFAALVQYPDADALCGTPVLELVPDDEHDTVRTRIETLASTPTAYNPARTGTLLRRDGTRLEVEIEALRGDFDGESGMIVLIRDMSERRDLLARMAVADRMRSVGMLAAGVAHEINNPLAYVLANLSLLREEMNGPVGRLRAGEVEELLRDAVDGAMRVRDVVRDLRMLSRADDSTAADAVDLKSVLVSCINMAANEVRFRAKLVTDFAQTPRVRGSDSRLGQVFLNLLINAAHAIPEGHVDENEIRIRTRTSDEGRVIVEIADTGCGIPKAILGRIFDPFFTTKPAGVGTGLGLAICHGIVKALHGQIDVESTPGEGTTFRVTLEAASENDARGATPARRADAPRRGRLLIVDDEPAIGTTLRVMLQDEHDIVTVTRAREALARIEAGEAYDVVLCDLMMPDLSGIELFGIIERRHPSLASRFVFLTGGAFTETARDFLEKNANPRLEKPFEMDALRKTIGKIVGVA